MKMPVIFVGHGNPINAIEKNEWSEGFSQLGQDLPTPRAILSVSAHWCTPGFQLTGDEKPETIHDFGGFPDELYEIQYPARGLPKLANRIAEKLDSARTTEDWGLDHGTWSVLKWMYPRADVPVVQLGLNEQLDSAGHLAVGATLASLRDENVLVLASGNLVHNLRDAFHRLRSGNEETPDWAARFDEATARALLQESPRDLLNLANTADGGVAHPTPDHWLPIFYAAGAGAGSSVSFPIEGFDMGSISMRAVVFG